MICRDPRRRDVRGRDLTDPEGITTLRGGATMQRPNAGAVMATTSTAERRAAVLDTVDSSPLPVAAVELPTQVVRAISPSALELIGRNRSVVGSTVDDITADTATGGFELVQSGRLSGYETTRVFLGSHGARPVRVWVRALSTRVPVDLALTVLADAGELRAGLHVLDPGAASRAPVIGTADRTLVIDRLSADVEVLLGRPVDDLLHRPVLSLVGEADASGLLLALAEATATGRGACVAATLQHADGHPVRAYLSLVPLSPAPSFAFAVTERPAPSGGRDAAARALQVIGQAVDCTETSRALAEASEPVPGLQRLTTRELQVVEQLMSGDRVPAIAASLFLSPSTVRNHLSSVFAKLGVSSQQELVSLLRRRTDGTSSRTDTPPRD